MKKLALLCFILAGCGGIDGEQRSEVCYSNDGGLDGNSDHYSDAAVDVGQGSDASDQDADTGLALVPDGALDADDADLDAPVFTHAGPDSFTDHAFEGGDQ